MLPAAVQPHRTQDQWMTGLQPTVRAPGFGSWKHVQEPCDLACILSATASLNPREMSSRDRLHCARTRQALAPQRTAAHDVQVVSYASVQRMGT